MSIEPEQPTQIPPTPGQLLRDARINRGLSQALVAKKTCLSQQYIIDIEMDDYSHFAAAIYTRGYLQSYARLVGVSNDVILAAYEDLAMPDKVETVFPYSIYNQGVPVYPSRRRWVRWMSALVVGIMVILVILWWQGEKNHYYFSANQTPVTMQNQPQSSAAVTSQTPDTNALVAPPLLKSEQPTITTAKGKVRDGNG